VRFRFLLSKTQHYRVMLAIEASVRSGVSNKYCRRMFIRKSSLTVREQPTHTLSNLMDSSRLTGFIKQTSMHDLGAALKTNTTFIITNSCTT